MEVEAKFVIADHDTVLRLRAAVKLRSYALREGVGQRVRDRYLDTPTRTLYKNGYACRIRLQDGQRRVTVKGLSKTESAIHQRFESEADLGEDASEDPRTWPECEGSALVVSLTEGETLGELLVVEQERYVRPLDQGERRVGEMSIDDVRIRAGSRHEGLWVLEVELGAEGTTDDLHALAQHLTETWGLAPQLRSKFGLGLALLDQEVLQTKEGPGRVSAAEREQLLEIARNEDESGYHRWAELILEWGDGKPVREVIGRIGMSRSWAYELLQRWREERTALFPAELIGSGELGDGVVRTEEGEREGRAELAVALPAAEAPRAGMTIAQMVERFQVDEAHARCVKDHALALYDATASIHKLDPDRRRLLEVMGELHNVGLETDPDRHHIAGRDIIVDNPLDELSGIEQRMLAAAVYLHRKKARRKRLSAKVVASLPPGIQRDTLVLSALLRMADGLDYAQSQTSTLGEIHVAAAAIWVVVSGPYAEMDAARAQAKADLWESVVGIPVQFSVEGRRSSATAIAEGAEGVVEIMEGMELKSPGVLPDDPMSEAGRKVLLFHLLRMLKHEPGTRAGEDIEKLHDMRVATRRMRAAFRVFGPHFRARAVRPYVAGLRRTARMLGAVRDLDVLVEKAERYLSTLPQERAHDLDPLLGTWERQRGSVREKMVSYLDSAKYQDFVLTFRAFLETPGSGARTVREVTPSPTLVCHVAPSLIYARWAQVQAFGPLLDGASIAILHLLRIECKRMRYGLEFYREVLGTDAEDVIDEVVRLQDHLGDLHDADVANALLSDFLFAPQGGDRSERVIAPGVVSYLAAKQQELQTLVETFPQTWERFNRSEVRQWLANAVAVL